MKLTGVTRADARRAGVGAEMRLMREEGRTIDREGVWFVQRSRACEQLGQGTMACSSHCCPSHIHSVWSHEGELYTIHLDVQLTAVVLLEFASSLSLICIALDFAALLSNSQA
ncbi:unnamed protein product [Sphagnum troendelagicum]